MRQGHAPWAAKPSFMQTLWEDMAPSVANACAAHGRSAPALRGPLVKRPSALATARLAEQTGATVIGFAFILELAFLNPREALTKEYDREIFSLVKVK